VIEISAIVCTRNRADILRHAIDSLVAQTLPPDEFEILIIDNGSTDDTRSLTERYAERHRNVSYVAEPRLGLSNARNTGLGAARADVVAFIDDDATAGKTWLEKICSVFAERTPRPGIV